MIMNYGKSPLKDLGQGVRDAEGYAIGAYDKGRKMLSDDVNTKSNRKWALTVSVGLNIAQALAIASLVWGSVQ